MAQAQLIQGTGAELLPHLQRLQHRKNLFLIIPEEDEPDTAVQANAPDTLSLPAGTVIRNGVPLFPKREVAEPITPELIKQLAEED